MGMDCSIHSMELHGMADERVGSFCSSTLGFIYCMSIPVFMDSALDGWIAGMILPGLVLE